MRIKRDAFQHNPSLIDLQRPSQPSTHHQHQHTALLPAVSEGAFSTAHRVDGMRGRTCLEWRA